MSNLAVLGMVSRYHKGTQCQVILLFKDVPLVPPDLSQPLARDLVYPTVSKACLIAENLAHAHQ